MRLGLSWAAVAAAAFLSVGRAETRPATAPAAAKGEQIIFSSDRDGPWRVYRVAIDGSGLKRLTDAGEDEQDVDPVFSPDGLRILFTSTRGGKTGVWVMSAGGTDLKRICDGDQAEWAPDGKRIVLRRDGRILFRVLEGGKESILTPAEWTQCSGPAWSPDGRTIALALRGAAGNAVWTIPADGGTPAKVYDKQGACEPHWSPDSRRIVYETETHICTINADGTGNRLITYWGGLQRYARFSPDGKRLVFCQGASTRGPWELYTVPAGGGTPARLTEGGSDMYPDWR